jgi:hypothetical protein
MPFSVKHLFLPDDPMVARRFQENFDQIVSELNSFPINGRFKPGSIATTNITDDSVTAAKFSPNLQFDQIPKVTSYAIATATAGTKTIVVNSVDLRTVFPALTAFRIYGSSANDGAYTVHSVSFSSPNSSIVVHETLVDSSADGYLQLSPTSDDHLCSLERVYTELNEFIKEPLDITSRAGGGVAFRESKASFQEHEYFFNWFRVVHGYCAKVDLVSVGTATCTYRLPDITTDISSIFHVMVMPIGSGLTTQRTQTGAVDSIDSGTMKYVSYSAGTYRIWITPSEVPNTKWWGVFYCLIGRTNS